MKFLKHIRVSAGGNRGVILRMAALGMILKGRTAGTKRRALATGLPPHVPPLDHILMSWNRFSSIAFK